MSQQAQSDSELSDVSDSELSDEEPCDPCDGHCPCLLLIGVGLLSLVKMVLVAPFALIIVVASYLFSVVLAWPYTLGCSLLTLLTFHEFPLGMNEDHRKFSYCRVANIWAARAFMVIYPTIGAAGLLVLSLLMLALVTPVFIVVKPIMDTWTAWRWQMVWGVGGYMAGQQDAEEYSYKRKGKKKKGKYLSGWTRAREGFGNGTATVLLEAIVIGSIPAVVIFGTYIEQILAWRRYKSTFEIQNGLEASEQPFLTPPEHLAWEAFFQQLLRVGESAIKAGLITRQECQELEPFLMLGLPGLVLLRYVVRTCFDDEGDRPVTELLKFLAATYRDQGEGTLEFWDGYNIVAYDMSDACAEEDWLEAKAIVEEQGFFDADSSDEEDETEEQLNEYAIFEAWVLYGERPDNSKLRGEGKEFLIGYEELPEDRRVGVNRAASKIREVALLITKAPSFQQRFMKVMEELGRERGWRCWFL